MSDVGIVVRTVERGIGSQLKIIGNAVERSTGYWIEWVAEVGYDALAATMNTAIKDAVVAEFANVGITVGALDKKTLFGGAVSL